MIMFEYQPKEPFPIHIIQMPAQNMSIETGRAVLTELAQIIEVAERDAVDRAATKVKMETLRCIARFDADRHFYLNAQALEWAIEKLTEAGYE